jgi:glycerol-3-phosphate dehydrogenase (NAD(P)+)
MAAVPDKPMSTAVASAPVAVIGAGSWGTALAIQFARAGRPTLLWGRDAGKMQAIATVRVNDRYLPGITLPHGLEISTDLGAAVAAAADVLVVVPSHGFRKLLEALRDLPVPPANLAWATKGFEISSGLLPHQVAEQIFPKGTPMAVLSGPTFAKEVGAGLPSAMTIAARNQDYCMHLAQAISTETFRAYTSDDLVGVEAGGAVKNALAIGAGISDGLGFGANTRVALITRGLVEMTRLGLALGARKDTFMGLSGMGDLVLTCTDDESRNRRFGLALAAGQTAAEARDTIGQVVEGYYAAKAVYEVAQRLGVDMPIVEQIYHVVHEGAAPTEAVRALMSRPITPE